MYIIPLIIIAVILAIVVFYYRQQARTLYFMFQELAKDYKELRDDYDNLYISYAILEETGIER